MLQKANYLFDHPFIKDNTLLWMSWILKNFENVFIYFHYFSQYRIVWHLLKVDQRSLRRKWVHWVSCSRANRPCQLYKSLWRHFAETKIIAGHSCPASCALRTLHRNYCLETNSKLSRGFRRHQLKVDVKRHLLILIVALLGRISITAASHNSILSPLLLWNSPTAAPS